MTRVSPLSYNTLLYRLRKGEKTKRVTCLYHANVILFEKRNVICEKALHIANFREIIFFSNGIETRVLSRFLDRANHFECSFFNNYNFIK